MRHLIVFAALCVASFTLHAAETPEIRRDPGKPQAIGVRHTLRTIPEACARIEGQFTGKAASPYLSEVVNTNPACHPRVRLRDAGEAKPTKAGGWIFNDQIEVHSAECPTQVAVVRIWRKPSSTAVPPKLDAQGSARVYIGGKEDTLKSHGADQLPQYAIATNVEGKACK
ncbi:hypothetical protein [Solilutibacter silvestris]|uniref:Secreted protein n=1 Tax=Solilutibacter silvestris TaxID=1645665 RepID=A0A2K1Q097_9GAMM|nr:hypothetical protein [Lysobacter silvestris]PNS08453.1 hypothetical protein Lysil_0082 [Lysobacter silvestris]